MLFSTHVQLSTLLNALNNSFSFVSKQEKCEFILTYAVWSLLANFFYKPLMRHELKINNL